MELRQNWCFKRSKFWFNEVKTCRNFDFKCQILVLRGQNLFNFGFTAEI